MEPEYVIKYELTYDLFKDWAKHPVGQKPKRNKRKRLILMLVGLFIAAAIIILGRLTSDNAYVLIGILFMFLFLYRLILLPNMTIKKRYDSMKETNLGHPLIATFAFSDILLISDHRSKTEYKFSEIKKISEDENYFYLWANVDMALRLLKNSFVKGDPDTFRSFITEKINSQAECITQWPLEEFSKEIPNQ